MKNKSKCVNGIRWLLKCKCRWQLVLAAASGITATQQTAMAQLDPHFSQYYIQPMSLNPALTGAISGDYRISAVWRSDYGNTLSTKGISGEVVTNKNTNLGLNLVNQSTTDGAYDFTNGYVSMAYTGVRFGKEGNHCLAMAIGGGFINRRFNVSKLQLGSQWTSGVGYDENTSSGEGFIKPSVASFDAGAGIAYYDATPNKQVSLFGGIAAYHITRPQNPFLSAGPADKLTIRYSVQAGARIIASDLWSIVPSLVYMRQGAASEKMAGVYFQLYASENTDFIFGGNWRMGDAAVPFAGFYYKGLTMGISYDVNVSSMHAASARSNSLEVSLSYTGFRKKNTGTRPFYCPRF